MNGVCLVPVCTLTLVMWSSDAARADEVAATGDNRPASPTAADDSIGPSNQPVTECGDTESAAGDSQVEPSRADDHAFEATIVTGERSRKFDSPARAMTELQRAAGLRRRAGTDQGLRFKATLTVNGEEYEFNDPDAARSALRVLMDAVRRLAKVRAGLAELGSLPEALPVDETSDEAEADGARPRDRRRTAVPTIRQRVQEAMRLEVQQNQGRRPDAGRVQQIAEIEAVRETLARAFRPAIRHASAAVAAPLVGDE